MSYMKQFLFENYGYYPNAFEKNSFEMDNFRFCLLKTTLSDDELNKLNEFIIVLHNNFYNIGPYIIKDKYNNFISYDNGEKYMLICVYKKIMNMNDLKKFHELFFSYEEYIDLNSILLVWKERVNSIESNISSYLKIGEGTYKDSIEKIMFLIGMAINAMQYLSDIINDHGAKLYGVTLTHKRIKNFESFEFFNPLNFIVDTPCKDIALLYQNNMLTIEDLNKYLDSYRLDPINIKVLMARILYRCDVFDLLENRENMFKDNVFVVKKEMEKIKKAYSLLKSKYNIRPIDWLEN